MYMKDELWSSLGRRDLCSWDLALSASEPLPATFSHACLEVAPQPKLECQTGTGARAHPLAGGPRPPPPGGGGRFISHGGFSSVGIQLGGKT